MGSFEEAVDQYHHALGEFLKGDAEPIRQLFSEREDVVLCNPLHPFARGPREVAEAMARAASHLAEGTSEFERVATFATADLGYTVGMVYSHD